jgi:hypothetical protein
MTKGDFDEHCDWIVTQVREIAGLEDVTIIHEGAIAPYGEDADKIILHLTFEQAFAMGMNVYNKLEDVFHARLGRSHLCLHYPCTKCETGIIEGVSAYFSDRDSEHADMYYLCDNCQSVKWKKDREAAHRAEELTCGFCGTSFKRLRPDGRRLWLAKIHVGLREEKQEESPFQFTKETKILWDDTIEGECFCSENCALSRIEQHLETVQQELKNLS